jgi:hypothetical protein
VTTRSEDIPADAARWVMTDEGRIHVQAAMADSSADPLAVASHLRQHGLDPARAATVQSVAAGTRSARTAGQPADTWWTPAAAEQASDPQVAAWRARRYSDVPAVDLTAGCGGDTLALLARATDVVAIERDASRVPFLHANVGERGWVVMGDATRPPLRPGDGWLAFADPARRAGGRRLRSLGEVIPSVPALTATRWDGLGIAVSPAIDLADPARPDDAELEFIQVGPSLREGVLWLGALRAATTLAAETSAGNRVGGSASITSATLLPSGLHRAGAPRPPTGAIRPPEAWLLVPAPALVRARLADEVADELGAARLARGRALYTSASDPGSPWFTAEPIEAVVPARPAAVRDALRALEGLPVEIVLHGFDAVVDRWWRDMGRPPRGGPRAAPSTSHAWTTDPWPS